MSISLLFNMPDTQGPEGGMRDMLNIECFKMNQDSFNGNISYTEANVKINQQKLGLETDNLHALNRKIQFDWLNLSLNSFKLKSKHLFMQT